MSSTSVDLLVVGGGPAGLSAALTFSRTGRSCMVYDSGLYRNANVKAWHAVPGADGEDPAEWRAKARKQLEEGYEWTKVRNGQVVDIKKLEKGTFEVMDGKGENVQARKVILATGIQDNLPDIPGLAEIWGDRAVHCIFCHGTETRHSPLAFLLNPDNPMFNKIGFAGFLKLWVRLGHPKVYILTHGMDPTTEEGLEQSGLAGHMEVILSRGYEIITSPLKSIDSSESGLKVDFDSHPSIDLGYIVLLPTSFSPNRHASPFLTSSFLGGDLTPMSTIPLRDPKAEDGEGPMPPGMGDDARTMVKGLFWAGNCGSVMGGVNTAINQGGVAGYMAAEELGQEDLEKEKARIRIDK